MMQKRISAARSSPLNVVIVTMDSHLGGAFARASEMLVRDIPNLNLSLHAADEFIGNPAALGDCHADIAKADIVIAMMLFLDDHIRAVLPALVARRDHCEAMVCCLSASEIMKLTRIGKFDMGKEAGGALAMLKRLRGKPGAGTNGKGQMKALRQLPKLLRFIPGTAQDVRAYFLTLQYWLAGSEQNLANMIRLLVDRYATGTRQKITVAPPIEYPEVGLYHPRVPGRIFEAAVRQALVARVASEKPAAFSRSRPLPAGWISGRP